MVCAHQRKEGGRSNEGGGSIGKSWVLCRAKCGQRGWCRGGEKMMEVGDDNNSERDVVSRSSICSSGGSNEIVHMYKSVKRSSPNILTVLFGDDHIGLGAE